MPAAIASGFIRRFLTAFTLILCTFLTVAHAASPAPFADGERVLFLGDSITRAGGWHSQIATFYATRFPDRRITWLNAGISGDTAAGALQRLQWDVLDRKPSTVVVMFGMNEAARIDLPGEIGGGERVELYRKSMTELLSQLAQAGVNVVLCTSSPYDAAARLPNDARPQVDAALVACAAAAHELAARFKLPLVDFHGVMRAIATDYQKTHPAFTLIGNDRIHPGALGETVMADLFLQAQGVTGVISETTLDAKTGKATSVVNAAIENLTAADGRLDFLLLEKALPMPFEGAARQALRLSPENELEKALAQMESKKAAHTFPGWDGVPMRDQRHRQILTIFGLADGEYELLIDDQPVGRWWHDDLAAGIHLADLRTTPQYQQAEKVAAAQAKRHGAASSGSRMVAFTRLFTLGPAGISEDDAPAVKTALEALIADPAAKDRPDLGTGGFAQAMAKKYLESKPKEAETAAAIAAATDEIHQLNQPVARRYSLRPVAHPLPLADRTAAFASRRQPERVEALAKEFCDVLILDHAGLMRSNLRLRPLMQKTADLARDGKTVEALNAFRDSLFDKLRNPAEYGLPYDLLDPYRGLLHAGKSAETIARADELMQGKVVVEAEPMPPGAVWLPLPKKGSIGVRNPWTPETFQPLVAAYLLTGKRAYLDQWIDYLDDWAMHGIHEDALQPTEISDSDHGGPLTVVSVYRALAGIARIQPPDTFDFPADSLARILGKLIRVSMPPSLVYHDTNPQNWTPGGTARQMTAAVLMDEFRAAEYFFQRARHRHENYGTIQNLPDGSETEHALWYNAHYYEGAKEAIELMESRRGQQPGKRVAWESDAISAGWQDEQNRKISERARYFLQMLTPQRQYPIGNRSDQRLLPDWMSATMVEKAIFEGAPDLQVLLNTLNGNTAAGTPDFTMSAFPYSGSWIMRSGWRPDAGYAHFYSSAYPTGGHSLRGMKCNNGFWLSHAGQDLLVSGDFGAYSYARSPLRVDGKEQFFTAGLGNPGFTKNHKGFAVAYRDPAPANWRAHSSENFDFAEGIYRGPYGDFVDDHHDNKDYRPGFLAERAREVITGVSHQRQVFHVKNPGLWILVDRLRSPQAREFTLDWRLPAPLLPEDTTKSRHKPKTFADGDIRIDDPEQTVSTAAADMPNLSLRFFGPKMALTKTTERGEAIKNDYTYHYKMNDFWRVSGTWQSPGDALVISLIEAIPQGGASQIKNTRRTDNGFEATLAGGNTLSFSVEDARATLSLGKCGLVVGDADSYEFVGERRIPIHRPIAPVHILPERNVITGSEPVSLRCETPGVEIRYTLDGSEPTLHSPLYREPFTIDNRVTVKARAFRPGLEDTTADLAGTHATVTRVARYQQAAPLEAVAPLDAPRHKAGLKGEYFEGDWKDLVFFPERLKPLKTQSVRHLFDRCTPAADKVFGWTYSGFLAIPEDGVYTFHAPEEMVTSPQEPGYSLRLFVGREMLPNNRPSGQLNEWIPATSRHAYGTWSIPLKQGLHPFKVAYVDYRTDAAERMNHPGMKLNTLWNGQTPDLKVSGHGMEPQAIPTSWFRHP
jgi:lysophospholipase L1-like esterase